MVSRIGSLSVEYWDFANCQYRDPTGILRCPVNDAVTKGAKGHSPMQNIHFRQALTQAIDKADFIDQQYAGTGAQAFSPTMPGISGFPTVTADSTPLAFDPASALISLKIGLGELGVSEPDEADVDPASDECDADCQHTKAWARMLGQMRFGYYCDTNQDQRVLYLASQWQLRLGFSPKQLDTRCSYFGFRGGPPKGTYYDIYRDGWGADFAHPDNQNRSLFTCGGVDNESTYCNPVYDALLDEGAQALDYASSLQFYHQAEQLLVEDAPVLFIRYPETVSLIRPWVTGLEQAPWDHQNVGDNFYETIQIAAH
jgi:ABC-type transport system substrate-binding protein